MPIVAVIPVKSFAMGKQRLSAVLDPMQRSALGRALAERVAGTVEMAGLVPLVVTADSEVAEWATRAGFPSLEDPGAGLDVAATTGADWARQSDSAWLIVHSDLPLIDVPDVVALVAALDSGRDVIAPSSDGGTSAIGSKDVIDFSFGVSSFHRHLGRLRQADVVVRRGLMLDVDSGDDLLAATTTSGGRWIRTESILST